jgi:Asp-tRNA(Asn)/Glu-tRNA(Gln) amidotransferase A subunit family amidase
MPPSADPATHLPASQSRPKFLDVLQPAVLKGARIGILEPLFGGASDDQEVIRVVRASIEEFRKNGVDAVSDGT